MIPRFLGTFLQRSAARALAEVNVEPLCCGYAARCSSADCGQRSATTIVRHHARWRPVHAIVEVYDEHADQMRRQGRTRPQRVSVKTRPRLEFRGEGGI